MAATAAASEVETTEQADKRKRRELLLALFAVLVTDTHKHLMAQCALYLAGSISVHSLGRVFADALMGAHTQATYYGRMLAGVSSPLAEADTQFARSIVQAQSGYLAALLNALSAERYPQVTGGPMNPALVQRLHLWAIRLGGTANEAWGLALPPGTRIHWRLGRVEHHCTVCPERAAGGPYTVDTMPGWPRDFSTPCLGNCDCDAITDGGEECFPL